MRVVIDKCTARVRVRVACGDNVKVTTIKEKENEIENTCLLFLEMFSSQKSNLDLCTNPVDVHVLSQVQLDLLQSRSLFAPFSSTRLSIK